MTMSPNLRKFGLLAHVTSSVGWLGAAAGFLALAIVGLTSQNPPTVRAAYVAMEPITRFVIVPLAIAALVTGIIQSLGTPWGLLRHYWVVVKLLVTVFATVVLLIESTPIAMIADSAAKTALMESDFHQERFSMVVHSAGGIVVLLVTMVLSVYKPRGTTGLERRGSQEQHSAT
jgi:hypothetical protein